jgi:hypothetical protein
MVPARRAAKPAQSDQANHQNALTAVSASQHFSHKVKLRELYGFRRHKIIPNIQRASNAAARDLP